jgi:multidrug efflux pump subunit AcrB
LARDARLNPATFDNLRIRSESGAMIPLGVVAEIKAGAGSTTIDRYDRERRVMIEADLAPGSALSDARSRMAIIFVPSLFTIIDDAGILIGKILSPLAGSADLRATD